MIGTAAAYRVGGYICVVPDHPREQAQVVIPQAWLVPTVTLDAVRSLQQSDTRCELERGHLSVSGVEVLIARSWIGDEFWPRIEEAIKAGYPAEKTYTFMRAYAERRRGSRTA
jgi:hypothetical protein